jgi:hypothetical protein
LEGTSRYTVCGSPFGGQRRGVWDFKGGIWSCRVAKGGTTCVNDEEVTKKLEDGERVNGWLVLCSLHVLDPREFADPR